MARRSRTATIVPAFRRNSRRVAAGAALLVLAAAGAARGEDTAPSSGAAPDVELNRAALEALGPPPAAAPPALGPDGLPIYDPRRGPPRSRVVGQLDPPPADAAAEAPVRLRRPGAGREEPAPPEAETARQAPPAAAPAPVERAAPPPPPRPAAVAMPPPAPASVAAVPDPAPAGAPPAEARRATISVPFAAGDSELSSAGRAALEDVGGTLANMPDLRLQLKAYAGAEGATASAARRLSLLRALSVRAWLIDAGVDATRIDVRALGAKYERGPPDRVDIVDAR